ADVARRDPVVARLQKVFPGFRPVNWSNAYEATAWCLISSRITMRQGQGIKEKMSRELGATIDIHDHRLYCFPGPEALIQLRSFRGLFGRKGEYLNELGRTARAGDLDTETLRSRKSDHALASLPNQSFLLGRAGQTDLGGTFPTFPRPRSRTGGTTVLPPPPASRRRRIARRCKGTGSAASRHPDPQTRESRARPAGGPD